MSALRDDVRVAHLALTSLAAFHRMIDGSPPEGLARRHLPELLRHRDVAMDALERVHAGLPTREHGAPEGAPSRMPLRYFQLHRVHDRVELGVCDTEELDGVVWWLGVWGEELDKAALAEEDRIAALAAKEGTAS